MGRTTYQNWILVYFLFHLCFSAKAQVYTFAFPIQSSDSVDVSITDSIGSQGTYQAILKKIDSVMENAIVKKAFPGAVLHVSSPDSVLFFKSYGYHTYDSVRPTMKHHIFDLASVTKVTAATLALMKLYDSGGLDLDAKVKEYVPGMNMNNKGNTQIRETLSHQAGWRPWIPYYQDMVTEDGYKKKFFSSDSSANYPIPVKDDLYLTRNNYKYIKKQIRKSDFDENRGYAYSGLFFYLIPELIEVRTGYSFNDYLDRQFFQPLGCETTTFNPLNKFADSLIVPTEIDTFFRQTQIHGKVHDEGAIVMGGVSGNAGLFSNAQDLAKIWRMWLNEGSYDTIRFLKPQTIDLFTTTHYSGEGNRRGLGFDKPLLEYDSTKSSVAKEASYRSFGHSGYTGPLVWADPETDLLFVFLANRVYPNRNQRMIYELNVRPTLHKLAYDLQKEVEK